MADTTPAELTEVEQKALQQFRDQMANPEAGEAAVSVMNESLGSTPQGHKIQFRSDKPGWVPSPAPKGFARWRAREDRRLEAKAASKSRGEKGRKSLTQQVKLMEEKLDGRNVPDTLAIIDTLTPHDREIACLAEERGQNRKTVLHGTGILVSRKTRDAFDAELELLESLTKDD